MSSHVCLYLPECSFEASALEQLNAVRYKIMARGDMYSV